MTNIITALENAEGGSRELDAEIRKHLGWTTIGSGFSETHVDQNGKHHDWSKLPAFTTSVDAAFALVPEGWHLSSHTGKTSNHHCVILQSFIAEGDDFGVTIGDEPDVTGAMNKPLPLAICLAALKAREASGGERL